MLYHDMLSRLAADMDVQLPDPLADTRELRTSLQDMSCWAQWLCRFTFKENEYQQALELERRDMRPCLQLRLLFQTVALPISQLSLPHCRINDGCPVAPLRDATVGTQLGIITVGKIDANFIRVLVKFNAVKLPDEEALQQNNSATIF